MDVRSVIAALGTVVLERVGPHQFVRTSDAPSWWRAWIDDDVPLQPLVIAEVFPFLGVFLPEAERVWSSAMAAPVRSELWTETSAEGDLHLEAIAVRVGDAAVLVIRRNDRGFLEQQLLLQRARELRFTYNALMREIERKDILLHTIVHDLTAPLHSIVGSLSLLRESDLPAAAMRWTELAIEAAARQRELIADILSVFVSEQAAGATPDSSPVDLPRVIERALAERQPVAKQRRVEIVADCADASPVLAEETRLIRVLTNLLDNAIRHSPAGAQVHLSCIAEDGAVRIRIEDQGSGVAPEMLPRLFQKLARDPRGRGTGLGLYFCRITVEQWGGGIGYEPRASGGALFWIRLPRAAPEHEPMAGMERHGEAALAR